MVATDCEVVVIVGGERGVWQRKKAADGGNLTVGCYVLSDADVLRTRTATRGLYMLEAGREAWKRKKAENGGDPRVDRHVLSSANVLRTKTKARG